jgi:hypothetical protein
MKPLIFLGSSRDDIRACLQRFVRLSVKNSCACSLVESRAISSQCLAWDLVHAKYGCAMRAVRSAIYVARFVDAIYVLHAFQKKTQRTRRDDIELAARRYRMIGALP